jgi:hypothetical protein
MLGQEPRGILACVLPSWQMMNLMEGAIGRQPRSMSDGGLRVLSRTGFATPVTVTNQELSDVF